MIQVLQLSFISSIYNKKPLGILVRKRLPENPNTFFIPILLSKSIPY